MTSLMEVGCASDIASPERGGGGIQSQPASGQQRLDLRTRAAPNSQADVSGRRHDDVFPLPFPPAPRGDLLCSGCPRYLQQRLHRCAGKEARIREAVRSINCLGAASARSGLTIADPSAFAPISSQASALSRIGRRVAAFGSMPATSTDEALHELLKTKDIYSLDDCPVVPLELDRLRLLAESPEPKPMQHRLSDHARRLLLENLVFLRGEARIGAEEILRWRVNRAGHHI